MIKFPWKKRKRYRIPLVLATLFTVVVLGCNPDRPPISQQLETPVENVIVRPAYGTLEELFQTEVINIGLEKLGYRVIPGMEVDYEIIHKAIARGHLDYTASHWHILHENYVSVSEDDGQLPMERIGILLENALQGYLIDRETAEAYNITNIKQLQKREIARLFDSDGDGKANLVGCNPGWGCERIIEHHLDAYNLRSTVEHDQGNYYALIQDMQTRFHQGKPVLYYTWTPFWLSEVLKPGEEVTWLEVPRTALPDQQSSEVNTIVDGKNLGFPVDRIGILANQEFLAENPVAKRFFEVAEIPIQAVNFQNELMRTPSQTPLQERIRFHAEEWIEENQEEFNGWLEEARKGKDQV